MAQDTPMDDASTVTSDDPVAPGPAPLAGGARVGDYEIVRALGEGAFGAVYEALRQPLGKRTALKVLHRQHAQRREVVERFVREARVVAALEHPHIVHVFDVGAHEGVPFIAMEFLEGETLSARLARKPLPARSESVDMLLGVMSAVAAAHDRGVIHRDLKPDNIFLARMPAGPPQPRLLDFGIAKVLEGELTLTRTNAMLGTPMYMSPEQAQESKHITGASDQWSLGVILYQCVVGERPFEARSLLGLLNAITRTEPVAPDQRVPELPAGLSRAILRALAKEPDQRFPTVRAFGMALLPYASDAVRAHWEPYFTPHDEAEPIGFRATIPSEERIHPPAAPEPHAITLNPSTRPSRPSPRLRGPIVAAVAAMLALARDLKQNTDEFDAPAAEDPEPGTVPSGIPEPARPAALSDREREVAELLLLGMPYRDIGAQLFISAKTVEHHVARIRRRLGAESRSEMLSMLRAMLGA